MMSAVNSVLQEVLVRVSVCVGGASSAGRHAVQLTRMRRSSRRCRWGVVITSKALHEPYLQHCSGTVCYTLVAQRQQYRRRPDDNGRGAPAWRMALDSARSLGFLHAKAELASAALVTHESLAGPDDRRVAFRCDQVLSWRVQAHASVAHGAGPGTTRNTSTLAAPITCTHDTCPGHLIAFFHASDGSLSPVGGVHKQAGTRDAVAPRHGAPPRQEPLAGPALRSAGQRRAGGKQLSRLRNDEPTEPCRVGGKFPSTGRWHSCVTKRCVGCKALRHSVCAASSTGRRCVALSGTGAETVSGTATACLRLALRGRPECM